MTGTRELAPIIRKKCRGGEHAPDEIDALVTAYLVGDIDDQAMTTWLRAVCEHGMSFEETAALTRAMAQSGETIDWSDLPHTVLDKHSTGGVGDAVTLVAVPLAAALGVKVAKLSGRALGHTGGTIDKIECIPGLQTELSIPEFKAQVARVGCAIAAASPKLAPADKKMYALRQRTNTVASVALIASSVLSKKIAGGAAAVALDVKVGGGALIQTRSRARELAQTLVAIGERLGLRVRALLTDMEAPLADSVGDALELAAALDVLAGGGSQRLSIVAAEIVDALLELSGIVAPDDSAGCARLRAEAISSGRALGKLREMASAQGGDLDAFDREPHGGVDVIASGSGFVERIDARRIGEIVASRKQGQSVAAARRIGVRLRKREGEKIKRGEPVMQFFSPQRDEESARALQDCVRVADRKPEPRGLILDRFGTH